MLMSLTTRCCPNWPDDSCGTISVVAIPVPSWSKPRKLLSGQTPSPGSFVKVKTLYYTRPNAVRVNQNSNGQSLLPPHLNLPGTIGSYRTLSTTVTEVGPCPAAKGEPGTAVNAPDDLFTMKPETLFP